MPTTGFSLKVFYCNQSFPHQLYASFRFDKLEGVMRLCPRSALKEKFSLADFYNRCYLKEEMVPGPEHAKWAMGWRGIDGGLQLHKRVGGDNTDVGSIEFEEDASIQSAGFVGVNIQIFMIYKGHLFKLNASKIAELDTADKTLSSGELERKWLSLDNPDWYEPAGYESESDSDSACREVAAWSPEKSRQRFDSRIPSQSLGDSLLTVHQPVQKTLSKGVPEITRPGPRWWKTHAKTAVIANPPLWAWNVTGHWNVTAPMLSKTLNLGKGETMTMQISMSNYPSHKRVGRQMWARFTLGDAISGYMRFCPASTPNIKGCTLKQFDGACKLDDGHWAGPAAKGGQEKWLWRWRGKRGWMSYEDGSDEFQDKVEFGKNEDGEFTMRAIFTYKFQKILLTAAKDRDSTPPRGISSSFLTAWDDCRNKRPSGGYIVPAAY